MVVMMVVVVGVAVVGIGVVVGASGWEDKYMTETNEYTSNEGGKKITEKMVSGLDVWPAAHWAKLRLRVPGLL